MLLWLEPPREPLLTERLGEEECELIDELLRLGVLMLREGAELLGRFTVELLGRSTERLGVAL